MKKGSWAVYYIQLFQLEACPNRLYISIQPSIVTVMCFEEK